MHVFADDQEVDSVLILASEHRDPTWRQRIISYQKYLKEHSGTVLFSVLCVGAVILLMLFVRSGRRRR